MEMLEQKDGCSVFVLLFLNASTGIILKNPKTDSSICKV